MSHLRANVFDKTQAYSSHDHDSEEERRLIEMFKNTNFIADSPTMIRPSRSKLTAEGIVSTPCDDSSLGQRNLKAVLVLPDLKERTSMSSMEGLFELSQKLAVTSPRLTKFSEDPEQLEEITDTDMVLGLENTPHVHTQEREEQPEETVQRPKPIGKNLLFKQRQAVLRRKLLIRHPIYRIYCKIINRCKRSNKKNNKNKKKKKKEHLPARVKAAIDLKLKNYIDYLQKPTSHGAIKYLKRFVASDIFTWLLTFGIVCLIHINIFSIAVKVDKMLRNGDVSEH